MARPPMPRLAEKIEVDLIVFDLDGTLADTLPDLAAAANFACRRLGLPEHSPAAIRNMIGGGERKLIERLVGPAAQDRVEDCLKLYLDHYTRHNGELTRLYPGIPETLARLAGRNLAVLSNKLQRLTQQALEAIDLARFFVAIRGGGEGIPLKPAPDHLLALTADLGVRPARTLMVGDKPADIRAGQEAGACTAAVTYGYGDSDSLRAASPDFLLQQFSQLPDILAG
jgi:phosphoglycolate phosphatase